MIEKSEQINELAAALSKAQAAIQPAVKDAENLGFKNAKTGKASKYADLAAVWDACRAPLSTNGLSVVQLPADAEAGRVALTSILLHASGQYISATFSMRLMQDTPHGAGSALTYLRRYALAALVGVVADEDDDGNAASNLPVSHQQHTNGNGKPRRQELIKRLTELETELIRIGGRNERKPFEQYTDDELVTMGKNLKAHLDTQKADTANS